MNLLSQAASEGSIAGTAGLQKVEYGMVTLIYVHVPDLYI